MSKGFLESWIEIPGPGTAVANSTTQASLMAGITGQKPVLPAGYFERLGKPLWLRLFGRISTVVTTPGTLDLTFRLGSIDVFDTGAMTLNVVAQTNVQWILDVMLRASAIGDTTSAALSGFGFWMSGAVIGAAAVGSGGATSQMVPYNTAPGGNGSGFDSTAAQLIDFQAKWSVANAANSIRLEGGHLLLAN